MLHVIKANQNETTMKSFDFIHQKHIQNLVKNLRLSILEK